MGKDINNLGSYSGVKTATGSGLKKTAESTTTPPSGADTGSAVTGDDLQLSSEAKT